MTYVSGGLIQAADYNGFVSTINTLWGAGSGDSGYGQSTTLATVSAGATVTATQWSDLIARTNSLRNHQSNTGTGIAAPTGGVSTITYNSSLTTNINTANTNRLLSNGVDQDTTGGQVSVATRTATNATTFTNSLRTLEIQVTFLTANAMRYFFNAGGYIEWTAANSALGTTALGTEFDTTSTELGTARVFAQLSRSTGSRLSNLNSNLGFWDLGTTDTSHSYTYNDLTTGGYNNGYVQHTCRLNAAAGSSTVFYCRTYWQATSTGTGLNDSVPGTTRLDVAVYRPRTTYINDTWGVPVLATSVSG